MRGAIGFAGRALAAVAFAALVMPAGCSPIQWDFVFVEDIPAKDDAVPEFVIPIDGLDPVADPALPFIDSRDLEPQTGVEEGAELYLTSLSFRIAAGSPEPDFSSFASITVKIRKQSGGAEQVIAELGPGGSSLFQTDKIDLDPKLVDLADYISVPYTITVTVDGVGPPAELWFAGEAIFSGTKTL